jgi:succinyl-CoA synthetase beta subunit
MELLEYQAKELFRQMGIPVLPSQRIDQPKDLKLLKIPYPVVLKSQVYRGGRGKAGGIKFVENTIDAVAAAHTIFHLPIMGEYPDVLLAEAKYDADREFYLAVVLDSSIRRPLLLGSQRGGIEIEATLDDMQQVVVDQEFSPFYARRLALRMGLQGSLIQSVSSIVERMYRLFTQNDLDLVEINPLAVSPAGELMALDGKVTVNDAALGRHTDLMALITDLPHHADIPDAAVSSGKPKLVELNGTIGVLCSGAGLTMTTLDLIQKAKGKSANFVDIGAIYRHTLPPVTMQERIEQGLDLVTQTKGVKVVLINMLSGLLSCQQIAEVITGYLQRQAHINRSLPAVVVRLAGEQFQQAQDLLATVGVPTLDSLDEAIAKAVTLSKA